MAEEKNLNKITSSKYDIYSKNLALLASRQYIGSTEDYTKTDFMKATTLGYITELMTLFQRDSAWHKTIVEKESSLSTATMAKTIYNNAKLFNINVLDAEPSLRNVTFSIDLDTIDTIISNTSASVSSYKTKYGVDENSNFMIIDKINPIIGGDLYFALEHSIEIYKNSKGKYIVKYCLSEKEITTSFGTYNNSGIISTTYQIIDGTKYLVFDAIVAQYKLVEISKIITGSSFIDTKVHTFDYEGQLCGLSLYYSKGSSTETVELSFSNLASEDTSNDGVKRAVYSIVDNNTVEVTFLSNNSTGLPQTGGELTLKTFITEGYSGNVMYAGDAVILVKQDDLKSLPITVTLSSNITMSGVDQTSLSDLKTSIINKFSTRDTIITENDLNIWFETQSKLLENVNNSGISFKKEKDNLLKRTFGVYLLLRDGVSLSNYLTESRSTDITVDSSYISNVVPTNTIDVNILVNSSANETESFELTPYNDIIYDVETKTYVAKGSTVGTTDYKYRTPFNVAIHKDYNHVSYYYLDTNDSVNTEFSNVEYLNNISLTPVQLNLYHEAGSSSSSPYKFTYTFTTDTKLDELKLSSATIKSTATSSAISLDVSDLKFESIDTDTDSSSTTLYNYKLVIPCTFANVTSNEKSQLKVYVQGSTSKILTLNETNDITLTFAFDGDYFSGTINTTDDVSAFTQLDDIMKSDLIINRDASNNITSYTIKGLPVVASYWMQSDINKQWFIKQLFIFINMLKANTEKLETTTSFSIKFKNTYGLSQYYDVLNTALRLKLKIYIDTDAARNVASSYLSLDTDTDEFKTSIKNEIMDYIRVCVDNANAEGKLIISKIIMNTQAAYNSYINHIDFQGLNGTFNQYVNKLDGITGNYPLEYFSLDETLETGTDGSTKSRLEKDIEFIFE